MKKIALIVRNKKASDFLLSFFDGRKGYRHVFFRETGPFLKYAEKNTPTAVIAEEQFLPPIAGMAGHFPVVAIITREVEKGLETAVSCRADSYIYSPYRETDLAYKLSQVITGRNKLDLLKQQIRELGIGAELAQIISSTLDQKELLYLIVKKVADVMPVTRCSIIKVDWLHKSAFVVASYEDPSITGIRLNLKKYPEILAALVSKEPVVINDIETDPLMEKVLKVILPLGIKSILVIPIVFNEKVIGTLFLRTSRTARAFSASEVRLLNFIASISANALYNAFLFEQVEDEKTRLEKLAITDYLTGIYNVRYFYHRIIEEFNRSERYHFPISCLMLDIDHFKRINDEHGHRVGDLVLKEFARLLKRYSRKSDVLARYGGEEFIVMLPQTAVKGAYAEAERIRTSIRKHKFRSLKNRGGITVSVGLSCFPHPKIKTHDELISFADDALFEAKNSGRDKVVVYK